MNAPPTRRIIPFILSIILAAPSIAEENQPLDYLNSILEGTSIELPNDPANYLLYESIEDQLRKLSALIKNKAAVRAWYQVQIQIISDFEDLTARILELMQERKAAGEDSQSVAAYTADIRRIADRGIEILSKSSFYGVRLFSDLMIESLKQTFSSLPEFDDENAVNTFLALLTADRCYLQYRIEYLDDVPFDETVQRDILLMNLVLLDRQ